MRSLRMWFIGVPAVALFWTALTAFAQTSTTPWTVDDVVMVQTADQFSISPGNKSLVWVQTTPSKEHDGRVSQLMLTDMADGRPRQLTRQDERIDQPRWSPDARYIAFLSNRPLPGSHADGQEHLWFIDPLGGEPWLPTKSELLIRSFEWAGNDTIIFAASEMPSLEERTQKDEKDDTRVIDDPLTAPVRLFRFSVGTGKITRITHNRDWIDSLEVSPDGKWAVTINRNNLTYPYDHNIGAKPPTVWIVSLATGESRQIFADGKVRPRMAKWAADGSGLYVIAPYWVESPYPGGFVRLLYYYDLASGTTIPVDLGWNRGISFQQRFQITPDGFVTLLADGVRYKAARYSRNGNTWTRQWIEGKHGPNYFNLVVSKDARTAVYEYSTASVPWQIYRATLEGSRLTNPSLLIDLYKRQRTTKPIAKTEIVHWKGGDDDEVEGVLYYPDEYVPGRRYPLVTYTHGGPMGASLDAWDQNFAYAPNLLTQRGAFVFEVNYHGSANYGRRWAESICCGKFYDLEIPDIEKGIDYLIAKGLVDPDRIGAFGWSNGAILTIQLTVADPQRFKAAVVDAGNVEWISDWGTSVDGQVNNYYFGKPLPEDPEVYIRKSPLFHLDRVRTPTLIFSGAEDRNVSRDQGWSHYHALQYFHHAPVRFLMFPGEPHGPQKLSHQFRVLTEEMAWFDRYLFHKADNANDSIKPGSLLDEALRRAAARKVGSSYGISERGTLVPELVTRGNLGIGRFEVTRAQFAAFDKSYTYDPATANYPANEISFERAKAYCAWLSKLSGRTYRLPNKSEVSSLYANHANENTLDHWAGYAVNPEDALRIEDVVRKLGPDILLRPVGSFPGAGDTPEDLIFDLGGNVAEWAVGDDSSGTLLGGSADRPADPNGGEGPADPQFVGFRVASDAGANAAGGAK